jgi:hypothetical protein
MPTAAEIIAQLNELPAEEHAAAITALQNDAGSLVKAFRSKVFAAGKKEGAGSNTDAAGKLTEAQERITELEAEIADVRAKVPDAAAIEAKWQKKLDAEKARADAATTSLRDNQRQLALAEFTAALTAPQDDGTQVDPEWVADVVEKRWGDRIVVGDDGALRVLQLGDVTTYDAPDPRAAIKLLAADARKAVPPRYVLANADTGAGIQSGGFGAARARGGVATTDEIAAQKQREYSL